MFYISKDTELTAEHIIKFIESFKLQFLPRLKKLERYYLNQNDIKQRAFSDTTKPNNKIAHSWGNYITDIMTSFFLGEPVSYSGEDLDIEQLNYIFQQNDEQDLNTELAKDQSKYGVAYELTYLDEVADIRLTRLSPLSTICIFDDSVNTNLLYAIRFMETKNILNDKLTTNIWIYSDKSIKYYTKQEAQFLQFVSEELHNFGIVPVSVYKNNEELIGDYELVIDSIDSYDKLESDTANESDYYSDCYMVFKNTALPDNVDEMKENRILELTGEGVDVSFLTKNINDIQQENTKNRSVNDIHKFSFVPNLSDESFANNVSGVAMKFKLLGLLNKCSIKKRKFKKGLQNRLWLISNILNLKNGTDLQDTKVTFKFNIPSNDVEISTMINNLRGLLSNQTLIEQLPFVENAQDELDKLNKEKELNSYENMFSDNENLEGGEDGKQ